MIFILVLILLVLLYYYYIYKPHQFWREKNVPFIKPVPLFGNTLNLFLQKKSYHEYVREMYNAQNTKVSGTYSFNQPTLLVRDLNLIKKIGIKEFDNFVDHLQFITEDMDPLLKNLFTLRGEKWRNMRSTLSPAFTSSKMKSMFILISECAQQFTNYFLNITDSNHPLDVELKDIFTRFANDVIATTAFGIQCNSLQDKENEFYLMGKDGTDFSGFRALKFFMCHISKRLSRWLNIQIVSKKVTFFFKNIIKTTIEIREKEGIIRPDLIHLLMEARKGKLKYDVQKDEDAGFATVEESDVGRHRKVDKIDLSDDEITAQAFLFFMAGFDTISTAMTFLSYELAINPDIQKRLQQEVDETLEKCKGKPTYDAVMKMQYLDMVLSETLRKWPPAPGLDRLCTKSITIPAEENDGIEIYLLKDSATWFPVYGIHRDPKYYPNPDQFDPERFNDENKGKNDPMAYLPFGVGPRNCIGSRFALMEAKIIMVYVLSKFSFIVTHKTQIPLKLKTGIFTLQGENGIWVALKKRI